MTEELWTNNYLIYRLKVHLATIPLSNSIKTDLLDWYPDGHLYKVIDARKYYNQTYHYLKIGALKPGPKYLVTMSDLTPRLVIELSELDKQDRNYVLTQAVALIFQEINAELYHNSICSVLQVQLVE